MSVQLEVFSFIHNTHPAAPKLRKNAIMRDGFGRSFRLRRRAPSHFIEEVFEEDYVVLCLLSFRRLDRH
jgi:hypothetical protein